MEENILDQSKPWGVQLTCPAVSAKLRGIFDDFVININGSGINCAKFKIFTSSRKTVKELVEIEEDHFDIIISANGEPIEESKKRMRNFIANNENIRMVVSDIDFFTFEKNQDLIKWVTFG